MTTSRGRISVAALVAALALTAAAAGASGSVVLSGADARWYWSEYGAAHALYVNGITWRNSIDRMRQTHCWGLGHWLVETDGTRLFSHFYCTATPLKGSQYDLVVNVTGPSLYAVSFAGYVKDADLVLVGAVRGERALQERDPLARDGRQGHLRRVLPVRLTSRERQLLLPALLLLGPHQRPQPVHDHRQRHRQARLLRQVGRLPRPIPGNAGTATAVLGTDRDLVGVRRFTIDALDDDPGL